MERYPLILFLFVVLFFAFSLALTHTPKSTTTITFYAKKKKETQNILRVGVSFLKFYYFLRVLKQLELLIILFLPPSHTPNAQFFFSFLTHPPPEKKNNTSPLLFPTVKTSFKARGKKIK